MMQIIENLYNHLAGRDKGNLSLDCKYHNLSDYPLQQTLFFNDEDKVREDIFSIFIYSYISKFEKYLKSFNKEFTFSYSCEYKEDEDISYYIEWLETENLNNLKTFYRFSEDLLDVEQSFGVLKYYEFLIDNSLQRNNLDAAADFLIGAITNVIDKFEILLSKSSCKSNVKEEQQLLINKLIEMGSNTSHTTTIEYSSIIKHFSLSGTYEDCEKIISSYIMDIYNTNNKPAIKQAYCI